MEVSKVSKLMNLTGVCAVETGFCFPSCIWTFPCLYSCFNILFFHSVASSTSTQTRVSAIAPSSTRVSTWIPANMSTMRSTALQRPRGACWGLRPAPRSSDCVQETETATWANCFPHRWGNEQGDERGARSPGADRGSVFLCSGSAVISATWTCPSWGSLLWWWLTLRGTSTWSCPTARWLTTRWENSTSPSCKMTASSSSGWLAGNSSSPNSFYSGRVKFVLLSLHLPCFLSCRAMELGRECLSLWG